MSIDRTMKGYWHETESFLLSGGSREKMEEVGERVSQEKKGKNTAKMITFMHTHMYMYNICRSIQCVYIFYINYIL